MFGTVHYLARIDADGIGIARQASSVSRGVAVVTSATFRNLLQRIQDAWCRSQLRRIERRLLREASDWRARYLLKRLKQRERELAGSV